MSHERRAYTEYHGDPTHIHCPVCGTQVTGGEEFGGEICNHVVFYHESEVGEFNHIPERIEERYGSEEIESIDHEDDPIEQITDIINIEGLMVLSVQAVQVHENMVSVGFDFQAPEKVEGVE